ncbi:hypothetical protein CONLIGDRAFT_691813 [Coniochaeta ligniaria NRRL 30616]|uniref:DUF6594 domain-containing protein n=1 Tax=Coniochaeta ligniaria NRRL 30616 TaxID=1408157 RepID=A0A1J7ITP6_9PEZI|nr:hypothetical protein CONLIGDRAFT_691813 [Coniochaeta ligniaria NRRL 30616]
MAELKRSYDEDIVRYVKESLNDEKDFHFLRLEFLQRINIAHQQLGLVRVQTKFQRQSKATSKELDDVAVALRDYNALGRKLLLKTYFLSAPDYNDPVDPFQSEYSIIRNGETKFDLVRRFFMRHLPVQFTYSAVEKEERTKEYKEGRPPIQVSTAVDRLVRLISSLTGGAFVVVPMFIMTVDPSHTKSLVTVSVAIVIFASVLSLGIRVPTLQTLLATTTYAAVLVVFVGSTTSNGQAS